VLPVKYPADPRTWPARRQLTKQLTARSPRTAVRPRGDFFMPPDPADANGDLPMTEQMTGPQGARGHGAARGRPPHLRLPARGTWPPARPHPPGPPADAPAASRRSRAPPPTPAGRSIRFRRQGAAAEARPRVQVTSPGKVPGHRGPGAGVRARARRRRTWCSGSRAARSCRPTTRCSTPRSSGTSWSGTSRGAGHAATGYAQATGRVGVCMGDQRPGARRTW